MCTFWYWECARSQGRACPSAIHCNTLQHTATHCNTLQHTATPCNAHVPLLIHSLTNWGCCSVLQCVAVCCSVLQCIHSLTSSCLHPCRPRILASTCERDVRIVGCCSVLQCVTLCYPVLQCVAVCIPFAHAPLQAHAYSYLCVGWWVCGWVGG